MANILTFLKGLAAARAAKTPASGEPLWVTDDKELYVGDGTTAGGIKVGPYGAGDFVDLTTAQTAAGIKTWSNNGIFSGNLYVNSTLTDPNEFYMTAASTTVPSIVWATTGGSDFQTYNRADNTYNWSIAGVQQLSLSATMLSTTNDLLVSGDAGIGNLPFTSIYGAIHPLSVDSTVSIGSFSATYSPSLYFARSNNATWDAHTIVADGDALMWIAASGSDGVDFGGDSAGIWSEVDGTPALNSVPGLLSFWTTAAGDAGVSERMRINSDGNVGIGATTIAEKLHVRGGYLDKVYFESTANGQATLINSYGGVSVACGSMSTTSKYTPAYMFGSTDVGFALTGNGKFLAGIVGVATENYTGVATGGMAMSFNTTPNGGAASAPVQRMYIGDDASGGAAVAINDDLRLSVYDTQPQLGVNGYVGLYKWGAVVGGADLYFTKSRSATPGVHTIVADNDGIGWIAASGSDGVDFAGDSTAIGFYVDGTPAANSVPGRIVFHTTAVGNQYSTERMRIDSAGDVGIGNTPSGTYKLEVTGKVGSSNGFASEVAVALHRNTTAQTLEINGGTAGNGGTIALHGSTSGSAGDIVFSNDGGSTERMRLTAAGDLDIANGDILMTTAGTGIDFSAATPDGTGTTGSEILDDYEEGTWSPLYSDGTFNASAYTTQVGSYVKIGKQVTVKLRVKPSNIGSVSGNLRFKGLPFTSDSATNSDGAACVGYAVGMVLTAGESLTGYIAASSTNLFLRQYDVTTGNSPCTNTEFPVNGEIMITATYEVA